MSYYIKETIPDLITIKPKEYISGLVGLVISSKYYFSIKDYNLFNTTIKDLIEVYNLITENNFNIDFSTEESLGNCISSLISSRFICIQKVNERTVSGNLDDEHYIPQDIKVVNSFIINDSLYYANEQNRGDIKVKGKFLSGEPTDYVTSFNGRTGVVKGGITTLIVNGRAQDFDIANPGLIKLNFANKDHYIASINGVTYDDIKVLQKIKLTLNLEREASSTNRGVIDITEYFCYNNNNVLTGTLNGDSYTFKLDLDHIVANDKSAVNKQFLCSNVIQNPNVITGQITQNSFVLNIDFYPLHFYDLNGDWIYDINWSVVSNSDPTKHTVYVNTNWWQTYARTHRTLFYTAMKVNRNG